MKEKGSDRKERKGKPELFRSCYARSLQNAPQLLETKLDLFVKRMGFADRRTNEQQAGK